MAVTKSEINKAYRARNPERVREIERRSNAKAYAANPEKFKARSRSQNLKKSYGITQEDYNKLLLKQNSQCAICGALESGSSISKFLHVDHDHTTGKVRGLLCHKCNNGLGNFKDSLDLLDKARSYLNERH